MRIHITVSELPLELQKLYNQNKLYHFGIDYQYNNLLAGVNTESIHLEERWKEVEVFNFTKYLKMDNRFSTYKIELTPQEIIIELTA